MCTPPHGVVRIEPAFRPRTSLLPFALHTGACACAVFVLPSLTAGLLDVAVQFVPAASQSSTRVYLGATAGMRLLDDSARQPIFDAIKERILKSPFAYGTAGTLSGEEEALFGNHKGPCVDSAWAL